jgi:hypothetical protein
MDWNANDYVSESLLEIVAKGSQNFHCASTIISLKFWHKKLKQKTGLAPYFHNYV